MSVERNDELTSWLLQQLIGYVEQLLRGCLIPSV
jgi:hypothetical protein